MLDEDEIEIGRRKRRGKARRGGLEKCWTKKRRSSRLLLGDLLLKQIDF